MRLRLFFLFFLTIIICAVIPAQTHITVPLDNQIYYVLEQAELRGLCPPLSGVKPYTQDVITDVIREILDSQNSEKLSAAERAILEQTLIKFSRPASVGFDRKRGSYYNETFIGGRKTEPAAKPAAAEEEQIPAEDGEEMSHNGANGGDEASSEAETMLNPEDGIIATVNAGLGADIQGSVGVYSYKPGNENYYGTETWFQFYVNGDFGRNFSYNFDVFGGLIQAPRKELGTYNTYYKDFALEEDSQYDNTEFINNEIKVYSEPLTSFPYTYRKKWDGSVFFLDDLTGFDYWPNTFAGGYGLLAELNSSFLDNRLFIKMGRLSREWGSTPLGSSLSFNKAARPFFGIEGEFRPVSWFGIASLTGALEYVNYEDIKISSSTFQNLYSITILQFRYKNFLFLDITDAVVYPKRFEIGYMVPIISKFFYQNNIGDFDNMAMSFNVKGQYPGLGNIWISFFMDEMNLLSDLFALDRQMLAIQFGTTVFLPVLSFSSLKLSYTIVNPYCYTHNRNKNPWYGENRMETGYVNNGVSLGHYLPPNSDELLVRLESMPAKNLISHLQYQMIRHGADFGSSAVDGSNLASELDPENRDSNSTLSKYFLQDGAYHWQHVIKLGAEWKPGKLPLAFYMEAGTVISYFTDIDSEANKGAPLLYEKINTPEYPRSVAFIAKLGFRLFPK